MHKTLILLILMTFSALAATSQARAQSSGRNSAANLTEEQRKTAAHFLKRVTDATSLALQGVSQSDYKLAVDVASYYENDLKTLPEGEIRILLTKIYLSHLDALVAWALYNGSDPGPMFSMTEFQGNLLKRYGIKAQVRKGNRPARDVTLRTIWRIQTTWEQKAAILVSPYRVFTRAVPPDFTQAFDFLEFIKFPTEPKGVFSAQSAPHWNTSRFMTFVSANGVTFSDVNKEKSFQASSSQIETALVKRRGDIFTTLSHLAMTYSIPYRQYSELTFDRDNEEFIVSLADWYRLAFVSEGGRLRLKKCDYLMVEGD